MFLFHDKALHVMTIERARTEMVPKLWGSVDLRPWSKARHNHGAIGEIWYERPKPTDRDPALLLKLLFTTQPLSIQVHPDDTFAHSMGLPNGKTEAWYVLTATPGAGVALGLHRHMTLQDFRKAVDDGSISNLVVWRQVFSGDVIFVPAGTIHAIGAGVVIAEIQQRGGETFRLFDYGRQRELHVKSALAVVDAGPADCRVQPKRLTEERTLLASSPHFVFERIDLAPNSTWRLDASRETWFLVLSGGVCAGSFELAQGEAVFGQSDRIDLRVATTGMIALAAYTGGDPILDLLKKLKPTTAIDTILKTEVRVPKTHSLEQVRYPATASKQLK